jgi:maltose alpha-D-glucosyltransferase / alpha-amylase
MSHCFDQLRTRLPLLPPEARGEAHDLLGREAEITERLKLLRNRRITASRIRYHGDFHLGETLFTGKDWMIIDFEGDPRRPVSERRIKRSALRDVCAMMRSFHYVAHAVTYGKVPGITPESHPESELVKWAEIWNRWVGTCFLQSYLAEAGQSDFVPQSRDEFTILMLAHLLEKSFSEIEHELEYRLDWVRIPVHGVLQLLDYTPK